MNKLISLLILISTLNAYALRLDDKASLIEEKNREQKIEARIKSLENQKPRFKLVCGGPAQVEMEIEKIRNVADVSAPALINNNSICVTVKIKSR